MNKIDYYFDTIKHKGLHAPLTVQFEIHNKCVAQCITCKYRYQHIETGDTTHKDIIKAIDNLADSGTKAIRLTGGEPIIAPGFVDIVNACLSHKLSTSITTTLLTKQQENIDILLKGVKIKLSLPVVGKDYHKFFQTQDGWFSVVKANLDFLRAHKKRFSVNYTIFEENYSIDMIDNFVKFITPYKPFYVTFFPALNYISMSHIETQKQIVNNFKVMKSKMPFKSNAGTIEKHFSRRKTTKPKTCHMHKFHAHIKRNGDVYPCCMSGGEVGQTLAPFFKLGNIFTEDIKDIYNRNYDKFKGVDVSKYPCCSECTQRYLAINTAFEEFLQNKKFGDF